MNHFALPRFWFHYRQLPQEVQELADKNFALLSNRAKVIRYFAFG